MSAVNAIAEAIHRADCGCKDWHPKDPEDPSYDDTAAVVVDAIRHLDVEDLAELIEGKVQTGWLPDRGLVAHVRTPERSVSMAKCARLVGDPR